MTRAWVNADNFSFLVQLCLFNVKVATVFGVLKVKQIFTLEFHTRLCLQGRRWRSERGTHQRQWFPWASSAELALLSLNKHVPWYKNGTFKYIIQLLQLRTGSYYDMLSDAVFQISRFPSKRKRVKTLPAWAATSPSVSRSQWTTATDFPMFIPLQSRARESTVLLKYRPVSFLWPGNSYLNVHGRKDNTQWAV